MVRAPVLYGDSCYMKSRTTGGREFESLHSYQSGVTMEEELRQLHLKAGRYLGIKKICEKREKYYTYLSAKCIVDKWNYTSPSLLQRTYPCPFCKMWHIGRAMSRETLEKFADLAFQEAMDIGFEKNKELLRRLAKHDKGS